MARPKRRGVYVLAFLAAVATVAALLLASLTDHGKKHDRPAGPVATMEPSQGALQAQEAPQSAVDNQNDLIKECAGIMPTSTLAVQTKHALHLEPQPGNSGMREQLNVVCNYHNADSTAHAKPVVAQTSFGILDAYALDAYRAVMAGDTRTGLQAHKIPASRLPKSADDGFEFTLAGKTSVYRTPGAVLRINGDQIVTIGFVGFDHLTSNLKRNWEYTVVKATQ